MGLLPTKSVVDKVVGDVDLPHLLMNAAKATVQNAVDQNSADLQLSSNGNRHSGGIRGAVKPSLLVAGGVAGLTAASAAVSAARRKQHEDA